MRFAILGPMRVTGPGGRPTRFGPREQRLLAILLLHANSVVTRSALADALWDDAPPATAGRQILNCVSQIRSKLVPIYSDSSGYRIELRPEQLDAQVFSGKIGRSRELLTNGHTSRAASVLREALALWRGPALAGIGGRAIAASAAGLEERRLTALERCLELELGHKDQEPPVGELTELVAMHPLRERFVGLLMLSLSHTGRVAEALSVYQNLSSTLAFELGIDPGPEIQRLRTAILRNNV